VTAVTTSAFDEAAAAIGTTAHLDVPLAPFTTYRVGGRAAVLARPHSVADLERIAGARSATGLPLIVVGKGSNMLVADAGFAGIAVTLADLEMSDGAEQAGFVVVTYGDASEIVVDVPGAASLPSLARRLASAGIVGFEWAVGIPGSIGGAVKMNAGGHGADMAAVLVDVTMASIGAPRPLRADVVAADDLQLRFRSSAVADDQIVLSARLALERGNAEPAMTRISEIVRWRREHQPGGQNCGSVFVNPVPGEVSAGLLIDGLGLRGLQIGGAWVSEKHANFIQSSPDGRAADVLAVMEHVRSAVAESTGFQLRSEVRLVGFDGVTSVGESHR